MAEDRMLNDEILLGLIKANSGGGGGTTNYNSLSNKPQIAGTELQGNKSLADLGIASAQSVENITNGESISNFAGVETALEGKQNALTAGDYIDISVQNEIKVNRSITKTQVHKYNMFFNSGRYCTITKYIDNEQVGSATTYDYLNMSPNPAEIDDVMTLKANGDTGNWLVTNLVASHDHTAGYVETRYRGSNDNTYVQEFDVVVDADKKLIIQSELDDAMATKQDTLTFDDTPTDGSNNPVKSNGIYYSEKDIYAAMGEMGAKNLIKYPFATNSGNTYRGITFTYDDSQILYADGTTDASKEPYFNHVFSDNKVLIEANKKYILSIESNSEYAFGDIWFRNVSDYTSISVAVNATYSDGDILSATRGHISTKKLDNTMVPYVIFSVATSVYAEIQTRYNSGSYVISNKYSKVMLRLASDTDNKWQPYAKTNKQLTDDVALLDSKKADTDMVAADFDATTSYTAGNYCVQDGKLYKFKNNHSGAWSSADVDEVKITGELATLKSGLITLHGYTDISASVVDPSLSFTATENCILWLRSSNAENVAPYYNYLVNNTRHGLKGGVGATLDHYVFLRAGDVFKFNDSFPYESTLTNNVYLV